MRAATPGTPELAPAPGRVRTDAPVAIPQRRPWGAVAVSFFAGGRGMAATTNRVSQTTSRPTHGRLGLIRRRRRTRWPEVATSILLFVVLVAVLEQLLPAL